MRGKTKIGLTSHSPPERRGEAELQNLIQLLELSILPNKLCGASVLFLSKSFPLGRIKDGLYWLAGKF